MSTRRCGSGIPPRFQALLADLQAGKLNCVIVKDVSRLGRHYILTSEYVERTFPMMGVRLICVNDRYDSADPASNRDSLLMPFKLIMNDTYVKDTAKRIRSSITAKMHSEEYRSICPRPAVCPMATKETRMPAPMRSMGMPLWWCAVFLNCVLMG